MLMSSHMTRITTLRNDSRIRPHSTISIQLMPAVSLIILLTLSALKTAVTLRANTDSLARLNKGDLGTNP